MPQCCDYVFCQIGSNDASYLIEEKQLQGVNLEQYKINLDKIIDYLTTKYPTAKICFIIPPPVSQYKGRDHNQTEQYALVAYELMKKLQINNQNLSILNIRDMLSGEQYKQILIDGIHLNNEGNNLYAKMIKQFIGDIPYYRKHWSKME